jgi:hypothetical protein
VDTAYAALNLVGVWTDREATDKYDAAEALVAETLDSLQRDYGDEHPTSLSAARHHGVVLQLQGEHARAAKILCHVHETQKRLRGEKHPDTLATAWRLGELMLIPETLVADSLAAAQLLRSTSQLQADVLSPDHPSTLKTLVGLAEALVSIGGHANNAEASSILAKCEAQQLAILDTGHPDLAKTHSVMEKMRVQKIFLVADQNSSTETNICGKINVQSA